MAEFTFDVETKPKLHSPGIHHGTIRQIVDQISERYGNRQLVITVTTRSLEGNLEFGEIKDWVNATFKPESDLGKIYTAVSGQEIVPGLSIDTDKDLLNKSALVDIEHYVKKDGQTSMRIREWLPLN